MENIDITPRLPGGEAVGKPENADDLSPITEESGVTRRADGRLFISPRAKNLALESAVDMAKVVPTGPNGRVIERDIEKALAEGYVSTQADVGNFLAGIMPLSDADEAGETGGIDESAESVEESEVIEEAEPDEAAELSAEAEMLEPIEEVVPNEAVEADEPSEPVEEIEEVEPTESDEADEPSEPVEEVEPIETVETDEPYEPVEEIESIETVETYEPSEPVEEVESIEEVEPIETVETDEPSEPVEEVELIEEVEPTESVEADEPSEPVEEVEPTEPIESDEPSIPTPEYADEPLTRTSLSSPLTIGSSFNAAAVLALRSRLKSAGDEMGLTEITLTDMVLFAVSRVLPKYPSINANLSDGVIRKYKNANVALAIDSDRGLCTPVIRSADRLSLLEISSQVKLSAEKARAGEVPDETNGSFTVSDLGSMGVESYAPVIIPPQTAALGVCCVTNRLDGEGKVYPAMGLSLTFDQRAVDAISAAKFLKELCYSLENFDLLLCR